MTIYSMIVNDKHEAIACRILPSDMGQKASYFWLPCQSINVLCLSISLSATDRNGTEWHGTENQTTQLCLNDQLFTQYVFVCMIVNGLK